ncbi:fumarylacetoacetate hydrolase family protein [Nonomuraea sp. B5E05]|uniref:fumarylacetoacetate hydrolase family protein n=1 Tax=Nonomuraea sp. B5E05 TaxID=3153569 RepID=UPI0032603041
MRLVTYAIGGGAASGVLAGDRVVDLASAVAQAAGEDSGLPRSLPVRAYLERELDHVAVAAAAGALARAGEGVALDEVRLLPPVPDPEKILCIGLNYRDHAEEAGLQLPSEPMVFAKFRNSLIGPADAIVLPNAVERVDYEAELAVVIGRRGRAIPEELALRHVAGVTVFNDVSARDMQAATSQWTMGKAVDTFGPCGPSLVTLDEVGDLDDLRLRTRVNGATVQDGTTADMVFSVARLISHLSRAMTLEPGDIIATGTPAGVGFKRTPPVLLKDGDLVEVEIDGLGTLANRVAGPAAERAGGVTAGATA